MVLSLLPVGNASDPIHGMCSGVEEYKRTRPPPSRTFTLVNLVWFWLFIAVTFVCMSIWVVKRRSPRLMSRGLFLTCVGLMVPLSACVVTLQRKSLPDPITHEYSMSCLAQTWLFMTIAPMQAAVSVVRMVDMLNKARYARGVLRYKKVFASKRPGDDVASMVSEKSKFQTVEIDLITRSIKVLAISFGFSSAARRMALSRIEDDDSLADEEALALSKDALTIRAAVTLMIIVYAPVMVVFGIVVASAPALQHGCTGCDPSLEMILGSLITYIFVLIPRLRVGQLLAGEPDPYGVVKELKIGAVIVLTCLFAALILSLLDPGQVDYRQIFSWEWFVAIAMLVGQWVPCVPLQIFLAFRDEVQEKQRLDRERRTSHKDITFEKALSDPVLFEKLEALAAERFCAESFKFIQDKRVYVDLFDSQTDGWRTSKASEMVKAYIAEGAIMQINIPGAMRMRIESTVRASHDGWSEVVMALKTCFDEAEHEIVKMLRFNLWSHFLATEEEGTSALAIHPGAGSVEGDSFVSASTPRPV